MAGPDIEALIRQLAKLPGLGPRSARRAVLDLIKKKESLMVPLIQSMERAVESVKICSTCGNFDGQDPCALCLDPKRDRSVICVVEDVADLWALERSVSFRGLYHVTGGLLSPLDGVGPDDLNISGLVARAGADEVKEIVFALSATVDGQSTVHYLADRLDGTHVALSGLAHGVPVGGELDYLDDGTLSAAMKARRPV
ncbi:MAG: recombination mediator RecR [Rhodospirillaceae bacterium]|nr:recombination mediator RecR [Rhodospirillaceae bacterium]